MIPLCTSVFSVPLWLIYAQKTLTTEAQRSPRLHREEAQIPGPIKMEISR